MPRAPGPTRPFAAPPVAEPAARATTTAASARTATPSPPPSRPATPSQPLSRSEALAAAESLAAAAVDIAALDAAIRSYTGCGLKATAINTVVSDGNPASDLMVLGEAPGAEEDRRGLPFVGASGKLLDRMLAAIGRSRETAYISNVVFWRPPGNRTPTAQELELCLPFVLRRLELVRPKVLMIAGGVAVKAILQRSEGIMKLRGRWFTHSLSDGLQIQVMPTYHPAFLLRSPIQKRDAWRDLMQIQVKMQD